MTIQKALAQADALYKNTFTAEQKTEWLSDLDHRVFNDLVQTHELAQEEAFVPYTAETVATTALLIADPYSRAYVSYLLHQMYFYMAEYDRANNFLARFNAEFDSYAAYYNRTYMPIALPGIVIGIGTDPLTWPSVLE